MWVSKGIRMKLLLLGAFFIKFIFPRMSELSLLIAELVFPPPVIYSPAFR